MKKASIFFVLTMFFIYLLMQPTPTVARQDALKASMERGKKIYSTYCLSCHQADGSGVPGLNPPLIKTTWVLGDKKRLINIVLKGMNEPIEIEGDTYENVMAPHAFLKDDQVADVLNYIRNSFGNKASIVSAGEVKAVRGRGGR
jgi:mono/diheme cytochrome c family protein